MIRRYGPHFCGALRRHSATAYRRRRISRGTWEGANACSIAEIAFLTGFSEQGTFSRAFKRWLGQAPAQFRQQALAKSRSGGV
ncbi:helix-turn-helix domain-containing protein [Tranquillimonas rosea]|uniref:helix-turn-helix domain-containing protein n=1 Tax=Tranquillimonas rosea TaxID=641238 RepID=UPI003BA8556D